MEYFCPLHDTKLVFHQNGKISCGLAECKCNFYTQNFGDKMIPVLVDEKCMDTVFCSEFVTPNRVMESDTRPIVKGIKERYHKLRSMLENKSIRPYMATAKSALDDLAKASNASLRCLIVGSGNRSLPTAFDEFDLDVVGFDLFLGKNVDFVADAHYMPLTKDSFDMIFIQAVLEHVVEPQLVADECARVLKPGGIVLSEAPFLQGIHEDQYDFFRFTPSAHSLLFKDLTLLEMGVLSGSFASFVWATRGLLAKLVGRTSAKIVSAPLFILASAFGSSQKQADWDNCNSSYVLARKPLEPSSGSEWFHKKAVSFYLK